jgi:sugar phosphate isomerase/epimerase
MRIGVKAWWKDADIMVKFGTNLMEVHLEPIDLDQYLQEMVQTFSRISDEHGMEFVIHNQAYWTDGKDYRLVDLASQDESLRQKAIKIVKKTLSFASEINAYHVIVHPGGIAPNRIESEKLLSTLTKSLKEINDKRLIVENMPWFYIMQNGEIWRNNICIDAEDFFRFSDLGGGVAFDICHAYLPTEEGSHEHILQMKNDLKNMIKHVHVSDAKPPHHEGLQIGSGLIDFGVLKDFKVGIVPEVIDGHKNEGEGFKIAIERLRSYG